MNLDTIFAANPQFNLIFTDLGHAYGKAKFSSRCKLTGMYIVAGEAIRRVTVVTRTGLEWTGHTSNRIVAHMNTRIEDYGAASSVSKCSHDWLARVEAGMATATAGTTLHLVSECGMQKSYTKRTTGKWQSCSSHSSPAQVLSSLKRSSTYRLFSWQ